MSDQKIREEALKPEKSYIIQAPAGSGKTELIIQRFLKLLAIVNTPEEIIAITFTRKAAAEMRTRLIKSLDEAKNHSKPKDKHRALTWTLAKKVIDKNKVHQWNLEMNFNRLRILTIDALAHHIASQMPILTGFGSPPSTVESEKADLLYQEAVKTVLTSNEYAGVIEVILLHLDNKSKALEKLLIEMLKRREQWLPHIIKHYQNPDAIRENLENSLKITVLDILKRAHFLLKNNIDTDIPEPSLEKLPQWKAIAKQLIIQKGEWRQQKKLIVNRNEALKAVLNEIQGCPPTEYTDEQWEIIRSLVNILPILTAHLNVIFQKYDVVDFTEVTLGALRALGNENEPSDYALQLDTQISHLLIDEFQDTSLIQFHLIEKLVSGWEPNDGRTLFLVGDPMQSIYRFRQAEVSLFLKAKNEGIGHLRLIALTLKNNFRSQEKLVHWFNQTFEAIFPKQANAHLGAIPYAASVAQKNPLHDAVRFYPLLNAHPMNEAQQIVQIIQSCRQKNANSKIAILVRLRSHAMEIIPELRKAEIPFCAVEIENLVKRTEIQDLLVLTRALFHLGDRIAWLSLLRAPWCGLTLADLHALSDYAKDKPIWVAIKNASAIEALSSNGKNRLFHLFSILSIALSNRDRLPPSLLIKNSWSSLGGPACLNNSNELINVKTYFELLESLDNEFTLDHLIHRLEQLYSKADNIESEAIQIMTIHKAKGLEFDHVILPNLERLPRGEDERLLQWLEKADERTNSHLILAPLKAAIEKSDPIYNYLKQIEKQKSDNEAVRLLYVAATRAKEELHLLMKINLKKEISEVSIGVKKNTNGSLKIPRTNSFAELLWKKHQEEIEKSIIPFEDKLLMTTPHLSSKKLYRLADNWISSISLPMIKKEFNEIIPKKHFNRSLHFIKSTENNPDSNTKITPIIGTLIHEILETIAEEGLEKWNENRIEQETSFWRRRLTQLGCSPIHFENSLATVKKATLLTLADPTGRWILSKYETQHNEFRLTTLNENDDEVNHYSIDRTFIDTQNSRWIIDYKSSIPFNEPLDLFLQRQRTLYEDKLNLYAQLMSELEPANPIKLGLYFPLCQCWTAWNFKEEQTMASLGESSHSLKNEWDSS